MTALPQAFLETRLWQDDDLSRLDQLPLAPTIFQEFLDGPADIRVTIAGDEQFAALIASSSSRIGIDSRLDLDVPARACDLPPDVCASLGALMRGLGLSFATIDLKVDARGRPPLPGSQSAGAVPLHRDLDRTAHLRCGRSHASQRLSLGSCPSPLARLGPSRFRIAMAEFAAARGRTIRSRLRRYRRRPGSELLVRGGPGRGGGLPRPRRSPSGLGGRDRAAVEDLGGCWGLHLGCRLAPGGSR